MTKKIANPPPSLEDLEPPLTETPGIMPPSGIPASVETKVRWSTNVNPNESAPAYPDDLRRLAAQEYSEQEDEELIDPVEEFLSAWQRYAGYPMNVIRLPDPASRVLAGNQYNRPCREIERLGTTSFDPAYFIPSLQALNQNSGGVFRVFLMSETGTERIPGAILDRIQIADPIARANPASQAQPQLPPPLREKSETERLLDRVMQAQLQRTLENMTTPPVPPPITPGANLTDEQRLALALFSQTDVLSSAIGKITQAVQNAAGVVPEAKDQGWKERLADAGFEIVKNDPQIAARLSQTANNIVNTVINFFDRRASARVPQPETIVYDPATHTYMRVASPPVQAPPLQYAQSPPPQQPPPPPSQPTQTEDDTTGDSATMAMLDDLLALLNSNEPLALDHPLFVELARQHPIRIKFALRMIVTSPFEELIEQICEQGGPLYDNLLHSPVTGPFLQTRLAELQRLCIEDYNKSRNPPPITPE